MSVPVVSIILPTYNRVNTLKLSVQSVLNQTFKDWELLVLDNGSTDGTEKLMLDYEKKDARIKYIRIEKSKTPGISEYLNLGIELSRGKYIARLDDDDVWCFNNKLKQQTEFFDTNPDYVLTGGGEVMVDKDNRVLYKFYKREKDEDIRKRALISCPFEHTTIMFRRDAALKVGGYKNMKTNEDWDFFLKLGQIGKFYNFKEYYTNYAQGSQNISMKSQSEVAKNEIKIIKLYRKSYPNYYTGFILHLIQYLYSFFPDIIKNRFQYFLRYLKRRIS
jgi:glycosyltransferase involved in cell wall biosynthesis